MISEGAIKREARRRGVDPAVVDLDYALGVVLWGVSEAGLWDEGWVLKGGTCLRKSYSASTVSRSPRYQP